MYKKLLLAATAGCLLFGFKTDGPAALPVVKVSENHRYFIADGKPFFWLGDTGWLLFSKMKREQAEQYLEIRRQQGFNVIQAMVVHSIKEVNAYGDSALVDKKIAQPKVTPGNTYGKGKEYDYWDHIDWIVDQAAAKGLYVAMVPVWGSVVKESHITPEQVKVYADFLAKRYGNRSNIIWINGGDIAGNESESTWEMLGKTIRESDPAHLMTFHPRGRTQSSKWFHNEAWLDFNCFQSGHQIYYQDTAKKDLNYGPDNWKYVNDDYAKTPVKPTLDAEPSYENIPYGLHDTKLPKWGAADVRRYGYWSVFAGACGYTYGNNDVMQMHQPEDKKVGAYGSTISWVDGINAPGAKQMGYLKKLMLSRPYFDRVPDQSLIVGDAGQKYNHLVATRGKNYAFVYTYTGRSFAVDADQLEGSKIKASWYDPRTGATTAIGTFAKAKDMKFNPPGQPKDGNDWVLVLDSI